MELLEEIKKKDAKAFTHGGKFHADDVFSSALLLYINPEIVISRGNKAPEDFDGIVFDIGRGRYDHHQKDSRVRENGVPYAAFGLLWEVLGKEILGEELAEKLEISTTFGETLSWKYLCYVREHPVSWKIPTRILYGEKDALTSMETIKAFAEKNNAELTVMPGGEHWFHTKEQMQFLDYWIKNRRPCNETENKDGFASPAYSSGNRAGADGLRHQKSC